MSVGLNLWVYSLRDDFTFLVNENYSGQMNSLPDRFTIAARIPWSTTVAIDAQIGLAGRKLYVQYQRNDEEFTGLFTTITTIDTLHNDGGLTRYGITDWSHGVPPNPFLTSSGFVRVFIHYHESVDPLDAIVRFEVGDNELIEDSINITQQLEGEKKFNLETSFGDLRLDNSGKIKEVMDEFWKPEANSKRHIFGLGLRVNGAQEFWGVSEIEDIMYDQINDEYIFNVYDWLRYSLKTKADNWSPAILDVNIKSYLENSMITFQQTPSADKIAVRVGSRSQDLDDDDYRHWGTDKRSIEADMRCDNLITEMQKHYGAFLFYQGNRQLFFVNRNYTTGDLDINDLIVEDTFTQTFAVKDYDSIIMNAKDFGFTDSGHAISSEWWVRVRKKRGEDRLEIIEGLSADEAGKIENALDLRQRLPSPVFNYLFFYERSAAETYDDYKELLNETKKYICTIDTLGVSLLNRIAYQDKFYSVTRIKKNYILETSEIEMFEIIDDSLHETVS